MQNQKAEKAWKDICTAHLWRCLADRSWSFFLPLYLSKMCGSIRPNTLITLVQNLSIAACSAPVAQFYKNLSLVEHEQGTKLSSFASVTYIENISIVLGGIFFAHFASEGTEDTCQNPWHSVWFIIGLLCAVVDAVSSSLLGMIVSKEWVGILFSDNNRRLSVANATLSRIDLAVATLSPLCISYLLEAVGYQAVIVVLILQHILGAFFILRYTRSASIHFPDLFQQHRKGKEKKKTFFRYSPKSVFTIPEYSVAMFWALKPSIKLVITAYLLLYFSVLSPGSVLLSWMNSLQGSQNIPEYVIAVFGSSSQLCGALATVIAPTLIQKSKSIVIAGAISQWLQTVCIVLSYVCFSWITVVTVIEDSSTDFVSVLYGFLVMIGISRMGLWSFDLVERQIVQNNIPNHQQTVFFNAERGMAQGISLVMTCLCYIFADQFEILVSISTVAVCCSSLLMLAALMYNQTDKN